MIETFTALLFAHTLADFILQTDWMVLHKKHPRALLLHGAIVLVVAQLCTGQVAAWQLLALTALHLLIDATKTYASFKGLWPFLADQSANLATLAALALYSPDLWSTGQWSGQPWLPALMATLAGLILTTRAGGFAIGFLMEPWSDASPKGLANGGRTIGILERALIFLFVLVGQQAAIGFLIGAKSVLRFGSVSDDRAVSEYVIIGTLASFGWALLTSYATLALIQSLPLLAIMPQSP